MSYRPFLGVALFAVGCVAQDPAQTTFPQQWDNQPQYVSGPPGGQVDPGYGYQQPQEYPQQDPNGYAAPSTDNQGAADPANENQMPEPSSDPQDPGYDMGAVTDPEIDATLDGYGTWEDNPDYGRVWRPNTTVVGVDFTPYETCGTWVWSDWGWNYTCDWSWGWLPFHYGRWGWFDGYWGWVPGHEWGPAWVEWRHGGGYVGWRPLGPQIRDHRGEHDPPTFHDHRYATAHDSHWRFASEGDFGRNHIRGHLFQNPAEGLRVTQPVTRPALRGNYAPVSSASLMRARLASRYSNMHAAQGGWRQPTPHNQGWRSPQQPANQGWRSPQAVNQGYRANETPTWRPHPQQTWQQPQQTWQRPQQTWQRPQQTWQRPQQTWQRPQQTWQRPQQTWRPPAQTYHPAPAPSHSWSAPSHSSWSAPSHSSWSAPSHSSSSGGGFHSSGGGGGGGGHSSGGGGGHSGGGGGHHR